VVGEVLDWLKEEVDSSWLDDCVAGVADAEIPEALELVDAGKKCTSVIGANGDYRSGMAREAVAYLLKRRWTALLNSQQCFQRLRMLPRRSLTVSRKTLSQK